MLPSEATDLSLLVRIRGRDHVAWDQFSQIYGPMVYGWARRAGLQSADARDLGQEVFHSVMESIDNWQPGRFRRWLWTIFHRRLMDYYRRFRSQPQGVGGSTANLQIHQVPDSPPDDTSQEGRQEIEELRRRALQIVGDRIDSQHWEAFFRTAINGEAPADVAEDLGVSKWVVYKAKSRVLRRLIREFEGLDFLAEWKELTVT